MDNIYYISNTREDIGEHENDYINSYDFNNLGPYYDSNPGWETHFMQMGMMSTWNSYRTGEHWVISS